MTADSWATLLAAATDDETVRARLLPLRGNDFSAELVVVAAERGLSVTAEDVDQAVRDARSAWWDRWV